MLAKRIRRYKIMEKHMELVKKGDWEAARLIFQLLKDGRVLLGVYDVDWKVGSWLDSIGCPVQHGRNWWFVTYKL